MLKLKNISIKSIFPPCIRVWGIVVGNYTCCSIWIGNRISHKWYVPHGYCIWTCWSDGKVFSHSSRYNIWDTRSRRL